MSSRIAVDLFGSSITSNSSNGSGISYSYANQQFVNQSGDILEGDLDINNKKVLNVPNPINNQDCVNKQYSDNADNISNGTIHKDRLPKEINSIAMKDKKLYLRNINDDGHYLRYHPENNGVHLLGYLNVELGNANKMLMKLEQDKITVGLNIQIKNVKDPTDVQDCATKKYVDTIINSRFDWKTKKGIFNVGLNELQKLILCEVDEKIILYCVWIQETSLTVDMIHISCALSKYGIKVIKNESEHNISICFTKIVPYGYEVDYNIGKKNVRGFVRMTNEIRSKIK